MWFYQHVHFSLLFGFPELLLPCGLLIGNPLLIGFLRSNDSDPDRDALRGDFISVDTLYSDGQGVGSVVEFASSLTYSFSPIY